MRNCYGKYPNTNGFPCHLCEGYRDCKNSNTFYIVSNEHTHDIVRTFWKENSNGYTVNLNEAGIYTYEKVEKLGFPIINEDNINMRGKYRDFAISVKDVELIGKKMICILN